MLPTTTNDIIGTNFDWLMLPATANKIIGIENLCRPPAETSRDHPWRPSEFDWLMLPITANDIIGADFDWLMLPTTTNKITGIKNLCRPPMETHRDHPQKPPTETSGDLQNLIG